MAKCLVSSPCAATLTQHSAANLVPKYSSNTAQQNLETNQMVCTVGASFLSVMHFFGKLIKLLSKMENANVLTTLHVHLF